MSVAWYNCGEIGFNENIKCTDELSSGFVKCQGVLRSTSYEGISKEEACKRASEDPAMTAIVRRAKR